MSVSGPVRRIPRENCLYDQVRHQYDASRKLRGGRRKEKADRRAEPLHNRPKGVKRGNASHRWSRYRLTASPGNWRYWSPRSTLPTERYET